MNAVYRATNHARHANIMVSPAVAEGMLQQNAKHAAGQDSSVAYEVNVVHASLRENPVGQAELFEDAVDIIGT